MFPSSYITYANRYKHSKVPCDSLSPLSSLFKRMASQIDIEPEAKVIDQQLSANQIRTVNLRQEIILQDCIWQQVQWKCMLFV